MDKINPLEIKNVLIVRIGKIGDIIATSFVFEVIKKNNPSVEISLITKATNRDILKYNPSIDKVYYVGSGIKRYIQLFGLKNKAYDLILDFNDNPSKTSKMIFSSFNAKIKCGYDFPLYSNCLDIRVAQPEKENSHIIDRMNYFLSHIGFNCKNDLVKPFFYAGEKEEKEIISVLNKFNSRKIIALNISAGAEIRFWETGKWIELIKRISSSGTDFSFILLAVKENAKEAEQIYDAVDKETIIRPELTTFQYFASFIKNSYMLISPDTSAVHTAAAFKIPVLALYPKSDWNFASWRPYKTLNRAVHSASENVNSISIDEVFNNFVELNNEIIENGKSGI
jgi:heptosyltransferase-1